jgi:hypothetical protein
MIPAKDMQLDNAICRKILMDIEFVIHGPHDGSAHLRIKKKPAGGEPAGRFMQL